MKKTIKTAIIAGFLTLTSTGIALAEKCYEEVTVPPSMDCLGSGFDKSADFSGDCEVKGGAPVKVEIECPMKWYPKPKSAGAMSQGEFCAALGLRPASFGNAMCASGERRPNSSLPGASAISYWSGTWGNTGVGGDHTNTRTTTSGNRDSGNRTTTTNLYCWGTGQKKDYDGSDVLVAYACQ